MGNKQSREDKEHLVDDDDEEIEPVFNELKLVLIGSHGAGKNLIGNAILRKKVFTFWKVRNCVNIKKTRAVSGRVIHLTRTSGWKEDWKSPEKTKSQIVHCVQSLYDTGPHAVLLALKVNSVLSESTIRTLESLLTDKLWDHTIVIFTYGEKLDACATEEHINRQQPLIKKCGQRYFVIKKKDSNKITDTIEELIIRKNSASSFKPNGQINGDKLLSDWKRLVERIKSKIDSISTYIEKLDLTQNYDSNKELLDSKNAEIERLRSIVQEKEREIERLQSICSRTQDPAVIAICQENAKLKEILCLQNKKLLEKDNEIKKLKLQVDRRTHADSRSHPTLFTTANSRRQTDIQLQDLSSNDSLPNWGDTLLKILEMLSNDQLKKMKFLLRHNTGYSMPMNLDQTDRVDLAGLMLQQWRERLSVRITRDLIKKIPRNGDDMIKLFEPFLEKYDETW